METAPTSLIARNDTIFGVCQALGDDFGFNPLWLRMTLAGLIFWNPVAVIGGYFAVGGIVAASRWLYPSRRGAASAAATPPVPAAAEEEPAFAVAA